MLAGIGYMLAGIGIFTAGLLVGGALVMAGYKNGTDKQS
jgi:hypothetical protein